LEGGLDFTSVFLAVSFTPDLKAFCGYITNVLLLNTGVGFLFRGIMKN